MKKIIRNTIITLVILFVALYGLYRLMNSRTFQVFGELVYKVDTDKKLVCLTFDDGPTENTDKILKILKDSDVKATFFVIGAELKKSFEYGKKIVKEGHQLGNHTYSHERMVFKLPSYIDDEISRTNKMIRKTGFSDEIVFRPPYCKKIIILPYYLKQNNIKTITCNIEPDSIKGIMDNPNLMVKNVEDNLTPGSIILMHVMYSGREKSIEAVPKIIKTVKDKGYKFVTVNEMLKNK